MQSKKMLWTGRVISALVILFLLVDGAGKAARLASVGKSIIRSSE